MPIFHFWWLIENRNLSENRALLIAKRAILVNKLGVAQKFSTFPPQMLNANICKRLAKTTLRIHTRKKEINKRIQNTIAKISIYKDETHFMQLICYECKQSARQLKEVD